MPLLPLFYVHEMHAPNGWIGIIGASQSTGAVIGYLLVRRLSRRRSGAGILLPALLAAATVPATLSVLSWLPAVAAVGFVGGLAAAGVQLALFDELMSRIPRQHGVTLSSVDQSIQNFALIMAPFLSGLLEAVIGIRIGLLAAGAIGLGAFALFADDWWKQASLVATNLRRRLARPSCQMQSSRPTERLGTSRECTASRWGSAAVRDVIRRAPPRESALSG
jgi:MFS family permease